MKTSKHLSFWEDQLELERFIGWCGKDNFWKSDIRRKIMESGAKSVLDVGAGVFLEKLEFDKAGYNIDYVATEVTDKFVQYGIEKGVNVVKTNEHSLPFQDNTFDTIMCYDVMNHQLDFRPLIEEMIRVCTGTIYITFFKPFSEEEEAKREIANSSTKYKIVDVVGTGVILDRCVSEVDPSIATCCYNFIHKHDFDSYLEGFNVKYKHFIISKNGRNGDQRRYCKIEVNT